MKQVEGGRLVTDGCGELGISDVPVSVVRLTPAREKALNIVLNNREAQGRYDPAKLADLLEELIDLPELHATGFDETTLRNLRMDPLGDLAPVDTDPDRVELTVVTDAATYAAVAPRLDALVREFDLETHVKRGA